MTLVEELRSKKSRDNRGLLDRAADRIEELESKQSEDTVEVVSCKDCFHYYACSTIFEESFALPLPFGKHNADRCNDFIHAADVAPRVEVAREIFDEIEKCMNHDYISSIGVYNGALELRIAELKQKYTEENT